MEDTSNVRVNYINKEIESHRLWGNSTNDISDGYHTFGELYYHRMVLFLAVQKAHKDISWKSKQHSDGTMFKGYFIVGINTPEGVYSYHYEDRYWGLFGDIEELEFAPEYDGHTPSDIGRLLSL